mmetsp:Transcript_32410/g.85201  ORF Transcript_32410/g.85201 Transcript_32410/m.85201 type:complete len:315 (-) Transcript_32410:1089-2033(-)
MAGREGHVEVARRRVVEVVVVHRQVREEEGAVLGHEHRSHRVEVALNGHDLVVGAEPAAAVAHARPGHREARRGVDGGGLQRDDVARPQPVAVLDLDQDRGPAAHCARAGGGRGGPVALGLGLGVGDGVDRRVDGAESAPELDHVVARATASHELDLGGGGLGVREGEGTVGRGARESDADGLGRAEVRVQHSEAGGAEARRALVPLVDIARGRADLAARHDLGGCHNNGGVVQRTHRHRHRGRGRGGGRVRGGGGGGTAPIDRHLLFGCGGGGGGACDGLRCNITNQRLGLVIEFIVKKGRSAPVTSLFITLS